MAEEMQVVRLRGISYNADFRFGEHSLYHQFTKSPMFPGPLRKNEAYLFVSKNGHQIVWIVGSDQIGGTKDHPIRVLNSRRWRIEGGAWNPKMLANYAEYCGIQLGGITKFEKAYEEKRSRYRDDSENRFDTIIVTDVGESTTPTGAKKPKKKQTSRAGAPGRSRVRGRPRAAFPRPTLAAAPAP